MNNAIRIYTEEGLTMTNKHMPGLLVLIIALVILSACGGKSDSSPAAPRTTTAAIRIETTGALDPGTKIGGITITGVLPEGVWVKTTPDAQNPAILVTDPDVIVATGVTGTNASTFATYDDATRAVKIQVFDQDGFGTGEFVTVNCTVASGVTTTAGDYNVIDLLPKDLNGADIPGLAAGFTVDIP